MGTRARACSTRAEETSPHRRSCRSARKASVKTLTPSEVAATGARIVLANTYHLWLRPGPEVVAAQGGLHGFMRGRTRCSPIPAASRPSRWPSGARLGRGLRFQLAPRRIRSTSSRPRRRCGCRACSAPTSRCSSTCARRAMRRAGEIEGGGGADDALGAPLASRARRDRAGACSASCKGGTHADLRRRHVDELARARRSTAWPSAASRWASPSTRMHEVVGEVAPCSRSDAPALPDGRRHAARFWCSPSAPASTCSTASCRPATRATVRRSPERGHRRSSRPDTARTRMPLDETCGCPCCQRGYSRAYLRHLFVTGEILVLRLLTQHNLSSTASSSPRRARPSWRGRFEAFAETWLEPG